MSRRPSEILGIPVELEEDEEFIPDEPDDHILEQQELEDFEGTYVNESEFDERL